MMEETAGWLERFYDTYPRIEEEFRAELDESLNPRGPDALYDLVGEMGLPSGSVAVDVVCGEGKHSLELAERFGFTVTGLDPVARHIQLAAAKLAERDPDVAERVRFELGSAEALPLGEETVHLVWCRDVLVHVADLNRAYAEFRRVLGTAGRVLVYQMFGTDRLEPHEAEWLWRTLGLVPASADSRRTDTAVAAAGLRIDDRIELGSEWGEFAEEQAGNGSRRLLHASRLLRDRQRYVARFGEAAYNIMLGDCLWHVYAMIGKLERRVYLLSKT
jgi:SAM-dependent methyltransferase